MKHAPNQKSSGHRARKRFGQNFLVSQNIIDGISRAISPQANESIVEIGPGLGVLTEQLITTGASVLAIELDRDLVTRLDEKFSDQPNFELINEDALNIDFSTLNFGGKDAPGIEKLRVVGNLPYNISTPILFRLLDAADRIQDMHFMLQKEVVNRLAASPGTSAWGRLSIMTQYQCEVESLIDVPPDSFDPPPRVNSAFVKLVPREPITRANSLDILEKVVRIAFSKRRKTLRNALKELLTAQQLEALDIDPGNRPEQLSIQQYVVLANYIYDAK